ncbi:hypothetical protein Avbf_10278 [Armadillidium vulgare]|nr:hypothetical protein Avbf_10278 [Armadillidium vulgare]
MEIIIFGNFEATDKKEKNCWFGMVWRRSPPVIKNYGKKALGYRIRKTKSPNEIEKFEKVGKEGRGNYWAIEQLNWQIIVWSG